MKKKLLTLLVGCVVLTSIFAGCSNKKAKEGTSNEPSITTPSGESGKSTDKSDTKESAEKDSDGTSNEDLEEKNEE